MKTKIEKIYTWVKVGKFTLTLVFAWNLIRVSFLILTLALIKTSFLDELSSQYGIIYKFFEEVGFNVNETAEIIFKAVLFRLFACIIITFRSLVFKNCLVKINKNYSIFSYSSIDQLKKVGIVYLCSCVLLKIISLVGNIDNSTFINRSIYIGIALMFISLLLSYFVDFIRFLRKH